MDGWISTSNNSLNRSAHKSFVCELDYANCAICFWFTKKNHLLRVFYLWIELQRLCLCAAHEDKSIERCGKTISCSWSLSLDLITFSSDCEITTQVKIRQSDAQNAVMHFCINRYTYVNLSTKVSCHWQRLACIWYVLKALYNLTNDNLQMKVSVHSWEWIKASSGVRSWAALLTLNTFLLWLCWELLLYLVFSSDRPAVFWGSRWCSGNCIWLNAE